MKVTEASSAPFGSLASRAVVSSLVIVVFVSLCLADAVGLGGAGSGWWLMPVALGMAWGAAVEATRMAGDRGLMVRQPLVAAATAALPLVAVVSGGLGDVALAVAIILSLLFVVELAGYRRAGGGLERIAAGLLMVVAIGLPLACMVSLRVLGGRGAAGLLPLVSMVAVVKGGDIAAYVVGSLVGRRKMAPLISPGKTWEGAIASVVTSLAVAWVLLRAGGWIERGPWGGWPVYGLAVGLAGMLGDLSESLVKRELGVKDSGRALGGLGGFLDLVDALLVAAPVALLLWALGGRP